MGIYQVTHKYTFLGQQVRNVFYYRTSVGEPSNSEWQDCADEIRADWVTELQTYVANVITFTGIDRRRVDLAGLLTFSEVFTSGVAVGGSATQPIPSQVAMLVRVKGTTTKPNRARSYLAGWTLSAVSAGLFTSTYTTRGTNFVDLQSNLNSGGTNPLYRVAAQWNSSHSQVIADNDISGAAAVASDVPATQRRRRIGVGI